MVVVVGCGGGGGGGGGGGCKLCCLVIFVFGVGVVGVTVGEGVWYHFSGPGSRNQVLGGVQGTKCYSLFFSMPLELLLCC